MQKTQKINWLLSLFCVFAFVHALLTTTLGWTLQYLSYFLYMDYCIVFSLSTSLDQPVSDLYDLSEISELFKLSELSELFELSEQLSELSKISAKLFELSELSDLFKLSELSELSQRAELSV